MKNMKFHTKMVASYIIFEIFILILSIVSYQHALRMVASDNPADMLLPFNAFLMTCILSMGTALLIIGRTLGKTMRTSMGKITDATRAIAIGKVDIELKKDRQDEFGDLMDEYQKMIESTKEQAMILQEVAEGNMNVQVVPRSEEDLIGNSLKMMAEKNRYTLRNIQDATNQVMTGARQVAGASEALAQGSAEQASAIEEITAAITEVADKTRQNASQANEAAEIVTKAIEDVKAGNAQMVEMLSAMQDINKAAESISKIIKVIDDIAFQTNILALNAAVEAARAGEAGKGFAVVAEEVRNLAAKSAQAASETADLIEDSIAKIHAGSEIANTTYKSLEEVTEAVKKNEELVNNIADASNYQATAVAQINQAIGQVAEVVQTNSATSEECAAAGEELENQVMRMEELLSVYNLGREEKEAPVIKKSRRRERTKEITFSEQISL
ncbi:MAG: methyl-accepting chemotaxis protein [Lachnospiraceae bacterium]|nr:methyl-accepting chemotaxis protein [Lachnospiraceae bacterium]